MDLDLMQSDYGVDNLEFFSNEKMSTVTPRKFVPPLNLRKMVRYDPEPCEIPLYFRRQDSQEDHRVPTLNNLRRVSSLEDLTDEDG